MNIDHLLKYIRWLLGLVIFGLVLIGSILILHLTGVKLDPFTANELPSSQEIVRVDPIENGIHVATGFIDAEGLDVVIGSCTPCHSAKLVTQNRATREGWLSIIRWMQATQNLWELGENEEVILKYLSENYAPTKKGRRANLQNIEWHELAD